MASIAGRLYAVNTTSAKMMVSVLANTAITATISGGSAAVEALSQRIASPYLGTAVVTFSGLTAWTDYTYTVTQGSSSISGSFKTLPDNQTTDYAFFVTSCDKPANRVHPSAFTYMRAIAEAADPPILFRLNPDDLSYVDTYILDDSAHSGLATSAAPETSGDGEDYAIAWAAEVGLLNAAAGRQFADRLWLNKNIGHCITPGDHAITGNHCRGEEGSGTYGGCDRAGGGLEEVALTEWDAFVGDAQHSPLTTAINSYEMNNYAFECGPCRFAMMDLAQTADPLSAGGSNEDEAKETHPAYGAQLADVNAYLDVNTVPFKFLLLDTGFNKAGQPWKGWWNDESDDWKTNTVDASTDLSGTDGHIIGFFGDSHAQSTFSFDTFWAFGCGPVNSTSTLPQTGTVAWSGARRMWRGAVTGDSASGLRPNSAFTHVIVHASESPKRIEVRHMDGNNGGIVARYELVLGTANSQFTAIAEDVPKLA